MILTILFTIDWLLGQLGTLFFLANVIGTSASIWKSKEFKYNFRQSGMQKYAMYEKESDSHMIKNASDCGSLSLNRSLIDSWMFENVCLILPNIEGSLIRKNNQWLNLPLDRTALWQGGHLGSPSLGQSEAAMGAQVLTPAHLPALTAFITSHLAQDLSFGKISLQAHSLAFDGTHASTVHWNREEQVCTRRFILTLQEWNRYVIQLLYLHAGKAWFFPSSRKGRRDQACFQDNYIQV